MSSEIKTLSQKRAKHAWDRVQSVPAGEMAKFADEAKKFPLRVRNAGLLQTLAFVEAKKKGGEVASAIKGWLSEQSMLGKEDKACDVLRNGDVVVIRQMTREVMMYMEWLVRFSEARKKEEEQSSKSKKAEVK
jgi:CRISPR type III-B/RAMP module-associated protein Cmr5